jgi:hypothetical protein
MNRLLAQAVAAVIAGGAPPVQPPDLENPYRASKKGNIVCALDWMNGEPAMFLMAYPAVGGKGYCIPRSRISLYASESGAPLPALPKVAHQVALRLGLDTTEPTLNLICDVVMFNVPDLKNMPKTRPLQ